MHGGEREGDAREQRDGARGFEAGLHLLAQRRAFDKLLDHERVAALNGKQAEDARDARMIEPRRRDRLSARRLQQLVAQRRIVVLAARRALDRDLDAELQVVGAENLAERAGPERALAHEAPRRIHLDEPWALRRCGRPAVIRHQPRADLIGVAGQSARERAAQRGGKRAFGFIGVAGSPRARGPAAGAHEPRAPQDRRRRNAR